jgi:hypothetical protein
MCTRCLLRKFVQANVSTTEIMMEVLPASRRPLRSVAAQLLIDKIFLVTITAIKISEGCPADRSRTRLATIQKWNISFVSYG